MQSLLSRSDAAKILGVSPHTLIKWGRKNLGPVFIRVGGRNKYPATELAKFLATRKKGGGVVTRQAE